VNSPRLAAIAERKALLGTRAELDRTRMTIAIHDIRAIVRPAPSAERSAAMRPRAAMIVAFLAPVLGLGRFARLVRVASYAMTAYRIVRDWRR
jgi:hypothetical protein